MSAPHRRQPMRATMYKKRVQKKEALLKQVNETMTHAESIQVPKISNHATERPTKLKANIKPGVVLIVLAGRFMGRRVVFLKQLESGMLLVSGPFKLNGCPLRRINQAYVIATSTVVDLSSVSVPEHINDKYFARVKKVAKEGEEGFFDQEKEINPEWLNKRKEDQKTVDTALLKAVEAEPLLADYLKSKFSLKNGQAPHLMKF